MKVLRAGTTAYAPAITRALPDIRLPAPRIRPWLLSAARFLAWPYLRLAQGNSDTAIWNGERLVEAFRAALSQETRLIVAFRHPYGDEAQVLGWLFLRGVEREAKRLGVALSRRPHALFVHGYEVPRWSGALVRWMLPRMGAMPIHHAKMDREGMDRIRRAIQGGAYPVALAPEGQVSYASDRLPRLEQGTMRLGLAAADDMAAKGREEPVLVLPLSVHRRYTSRSAAGFERLLSALERALGYPRAVAPVRERLGRARDELISRAERFYGLSAEPLSLLEERLAAIVLAAVESGERLLDIRHKPQALIDRVYGIRQKGWDLIYLAGEPRALPPLDRSLADRRAAEAWYAMRHMELADFAWYFRTDLPPAAGHGPDGGASSAELIEYAQNLWDFANRLMGGAISGRKNVRPHESVIIAAEPINLSARLADYHSDRRLCVERATADLAAAYNGCIEEFKHG